MDVIEWTGEVACRLQAALRMSNEAFAAKLGIAARTVAVWHERPDVVPRPVMQQALDTLLGRADESAGRRFVLLGQVDEPAQALRVAIAVVVHDDQVLLVHRRGDEQLGWQFPAGIVKPGQRASAVAVQETLAETGVRCVAAEKVGERVHPVTGVWCDYWVCDYLDGEPVNRDVVENADVAWAPTGSLGRYIPVGRVFAPVLELLTGGQALSASSR